MSAADKSSEATTASAAETVSTIGATGFENKQSISDIPLDPTELQIDVPQVVDLLPSQAQPFWEAIQRIPFLESLIIVITFWVLAYLIRQYAIRLIENIAGRTESDVDDLIINQLRHVFIPRGDDGCNALLARLLSQRPDHIIGFYPFNHQ